jgi:hypothetical protein
VKHPVRVFGLETLLRPLASSVEVAGEGNDSSVKVILDMMGRSICQAIWTLLPLADSAYLIAVHRASKRQMKMSLLLGGEDLVWVRD